MPEVNLAAVRRHSRDLFDLNNGLITYHNGSDRNALKVSQTNILQLISRKKEQEIDIKKNEENKRILIAMLRYFPLSEQENTPDYVDLLEENFPEILYEYCLHEQRSEIPHPLNAQEYLAAKAIGPNNGSPNTGAQIATRLNRLLQKEHFVNGLFNHYNQRALIGSPIFIINLEKIPEPLVQRYIAQNNHEQSYFLNRHSTVGEFLKPLLARLPYSLYKFFYGETNNQKLTSLLCRSSAKNLAVVVARPELAPVPVASEPASAPEPVPAAPAPASEPAATYSNVASLLGTPIKLADKTEVAPASGGYSPPPVSSQYQAMPPVSPSNRDIIVTLNTNKTEDVYTPPLIKTNTVPPELNDPENYSPIPTPKGGFQIEHRTGVARTLTFELGPPVDASRTVETDDQSLHSAVSINPII